MKKRLTILMLLICFFLSGCNNASIENPIKIYETLEEINEIADVDLVSLEQENIENELFKIIDNTTAVYGFTMNGYEYYERGCKDTTIDMSGVFVNGKPMFTNPEEKLSFKEGEGYKVYRFLYNDRQYIFGVHDEEKMSIEEFGSQFQEVEKKIKEASISLETKNIIGEYQDSYSQRAAASIEPINNNEVSIIVTWSNSATEYEAWYITGQIFDNKILYNNISHYLYAVDEEGSETGKQLDDYQEGYFEIEQNKILWSGSGNNQTKECIFEKVQ